MAQEGPDLCNREEGCMHVLRASEFEGVMKIKKRIGTVTELCKCLQSLCLRQGHQAGRAPPLST